MNIPNVKDLTYKSPGKLYLTIIKWLIKRNISKCIIKANKNFKKKLDVTIRPYNQGLSINTYWSDSIYIDIYGNNQDMKNLIIPIEYDLLELGYKITYTQDVNSVYEFKIEW